jgi:hypothetical protein
MNLTPPSSSKVVVMMTMTMMMLMEVVSFLRLHNSTKNYTFVEEIV